MVDLAKQNKLFNWGAIELPVFFNTPAPTRNSHTLRSQITTATRSPPRSTPRYWNHQMAEAHALFWATAGHIPANNAVTDSAEYKAMQPQATYASLTANGVFDPQSKFAGVASPLFDAAGNSLDARHQRRDISGGGGRRNGIDFERPEVAVVPHRSAVGEKPTAGEHARNGDAQRTEPREFLIATILVAPFVIVYGWMFVYPPRGCSSSASPTRR